MEIFFVVIDRDLFGDLGCEGTGILLGRRRDEYNHQTMPPTIRSMMTMSAMAPSPRIRAARASLI